MNIRPRFSIRALLILVSMVGLYFGCWEVTKQLGLGHPHTQDVDRFEGESVFFLDDGAFGSSPAPFIVSRIRGEIPQSGEIPPQSSFSNFFIGMFRIGRTREYHLWFFGYTAKLFERELPPPRLVP